MYRKTLPILALAALLMIGCKNNNDSFEYKAGTGNETPHEQGAHYDDAGNQAHPDKADHMGGTPATTEADSLSMADRETLLKIIESNRKEIAFSKLGVAKLTRANLKSTANMLIEHHQQMLDGLTKLAETKMIALPPAPPAPTLNAAAGDAFDKQWASMQISMHEQSLSTNQNALSSVQSPAFQTLIKGAIPVIESHLNQLKQQAPK